MAKNQNPAPVSETADNLDDVEFKDLILDAPFIRWPEQGGLTLTGEILNFFVQEPFGARKKPSHGCKLQLVRDVDIDSTDKEGVVTTKTHRAKTAVRFDMPAGLMALRELPVGTLVRITCYGKRKPADGGAPVWQFKVGHGSR